MAFVLLSPIFEIEYIVPLQSALLCEKVNGISTAIMGGMLS